MNFFNDLDKFASNTAIITEKSEKINYGDLLSFADTIGKQIENIIPEEYQKKQQYCYQYIQERLRW